MERMIGRTFYKRLRLLNGRSETVTTRFELDEATGRLVEHVTMQTHDARLEGTAAHPARAPRASHADSRGAHSLEARPTVNRT
jgi:hypothetical protein